MRNIARATTEERQELFIAAAAKMNLPEAIVEKDFWVCFILDYLFHTCKWKDAFAFKGGTSLSKAYNLIARFSEDIDLILDWRVLGYEKDEPWLPRSNTKQLIFLDDAKQRLFRFLKEEFLPSFIFEVSELIAAPISAYISGDDAGTVHFVYPNSFSNSSILSEIRLEIGAMAAWTPTQTAVIKPYAAECYPAVFVLPDTAILTTTAERSFWEKATILHQEANRPDGSLIPARYSRHYYDLYCMSQSPIKESAIAQPDLLTQVAEFKMKFYPRNWARYDLARQKTIQLMPAAHSIERLKEDYAAMRSMIYGEYPPFEAVLAGINTLEADIHKNDSGIDQNNAKHLYTFLI